ncbi:DMT family transporter [Undibacterium sp. TS12]|uniref:DMT family transporter n=1 Tax=Undibacterium sp. TS12 TaxID=2908202 RepID=UPI001F4C58DA|nr:DMT family transporter [Undibacterium sp. TS12]MCH8619587.1 DMT family transporter [Undibacterium sp. TS12]
MSIAVLFGSIAAFIWGAQPVVSKLGYRALLTVTDLTFLRYLLSGVLMLPYVWRQGLGSACGLGWRRASVLILLAGPLYSLVLTGGLTWAPASHGALIYPAFTPLFSTVFGRLIFKQKEPISAPGLVLLVIGMLAIATENIMHSANGADSSAWIGDLFFVAAAIMWSLYIGLMRKWKTEPMAVVGVIQVGGFAYVPLYLLYKGSAIFDAPAQVLLEQAVYHGLIVSIISIAMFNHAVQLLGIRASMFTVLAPVVGVALSVAVLGEQASVWMGVGTMAVVAGLVLALRKK